tara:strand:- start:973 stop:1194 length:222 start_codon:yes stop_codon:yes gene_type:complete
VDHEAGMQRAEGAARHDGAARAAARVCALGDRQRGACLVQGRPTSGTYRAVSVVLAGEAPEALVPVADERHVG